MNSPERRAASPFGTALTRRLGLVGWWASHPVTARVGPAARFVVLAEARSGSSLLCSLLDSHPHIRCEGEILRHRHPRLDPLVFLDGHAARARLKGAQAYGFKLLASPDWWNQKALAHEDIPRLVEHGFVVVGLRRRDMLAKAVSWLHAKTLGQWRWRELDDDARSTITVTADELYEALERVEVADRIQQDVASEFASLSLVYEDDLVDAAAQQATAARIAELLGLPPAPVRSELKKTAPPRLADRVANPDVVVQALESSAWADLVPSLGLDR